MQQATPSGALVVFRSTLGVLAALAALVFLATMATAATGTGAEIQIDPAGDADAPNMFGWDILRIGATTQNTGSTLNQGSITFYIKVDTKVNAASPVCPECPRRPTLADFPAAGTNPPGFQINFNVQGRCLSIKPWNAPAASANWGNLQLMKNGVGCNPSSDPTAWTGGTLVPSGVLNPTWVCNEARLTVPRALLYDPPAPAPPNGIPIPITGLMAVGGTATANIPVRDMILVNGTVGIYTLGANGPSPDPTGLTANYIAPPYPPTVRLTWSAPAGGNDVTGYLIERRVLPMGSFSTIATLGPMLNPPTTYDDTPAWNASDYEYRITALRCDDMSIASNAITARVNVPGVPPAIAQIATFGPGIEGALGPNGEAYTSQGSCLDSHVEFYDISTTQNPPLLQRLWDLGDSTTSSAPSLVHVYDTPGPKTVTLTIQDSALQWSTVTIGVMALGDPNCCPALNPLNDFVVIEGQVMQFQVTATDPDGGPITFFITELGPPLPEHRFNTSTGAFRWETRAGQGGTYPVQVNVHQAAIASPQSDPCTDSQMVMLRVVPNLSTTDSDSDGIPDYMDLCAAVPDHDQLDRDRDGRGDACDLEPCGPQGLAPACSAEEEQARLAIRRPSDVDRDGIVDAHDNCPRNANNSQADADGDRQGDVCDLDLDGDGILNTQDNCPTVADRFQKDTDGDGEGDACEHETVAGAPGLQDTQGLAKPAATAEDARFRGMEWGALTFALVVVGTILLGAYLRRRA